MIARRWLGVMIAAFVTAGLGFLVFSNLAIQSDLAFFQPGAPSRVSELAIGQLKSGPASRLILVGIEDASARDLAGLSRALVETLATSNDFVRIANGANALDERTLQFLFEHRYILGPEIRNQAFSVPELRRSISEAVDQLAGFSGYATSDLLPADPTARSLALARAWQGKFNVHYKHGLWFSQDEKRALLIAETAANADDDIGQERAQATLEAAFAEIPGASHARLVVTGPPVISLTVSRLIQNQAWWIGIGSVLIVIVTLGLAFRSPGLHVIIALPTAAAAIAGAATVQAFFGSIHGIALAFGATLVGVTSDYPVHLISHLRHGLSARDALRRIAGPFGVGAGTTAAAFLPMTLSSYSGLSQLGTFAVVGIVAAAMMTAFLLPRLLQGYQPREVTDALNRILPDLSQARVVLMAVGAVSFIWMAVSDVALFSDDLGRLSPVPAQLVALDRDLRNEIGAADVRRLIVIEGESAQDALIKSERVTSVLHQLVEERVIGSYEAPSDYLPSAESQGRRQALLPPEEELRRAIVAAVDGLPVSAETFEPFIQEVSATKLLSPLGPQDVLSVPLLGERIASLLSRQANGTWLAFVLLSGVSQPDQLVSALKQVEDDSIHYLDLQKEAIQLFAAYRVESLQWLAGGLVIVVMVLFLAVPFRRAIRILISLMVSLSTTAGILVAVGNSLTPFHVVSLLLVAGMGLDYALFVSREDVNEADLQQTRRSVVICAVTTIGAFGLMTISTAPILRGIGLTVAIGVTLAFVSALAICGARERSIV
jgi:predicted exporter